MGNSNLLGLQGREKLINWKEQLLRLEGAYSEGTLKAYNNDIRIYVAWCENLRQAPFPAAPETVANFIAHEAQRLSNATLKRRLAALGKIHRLMRFTDPIKDEEVLLAVRRAQRSKLSRPRQALGLTKDLRDILINNCPDSLAGKRNRALIAVGYDTLCRRSELVNLYIEDLTHKNDLAQILIKKSKNDPLGMGRYAYLSPRTYNYLIIWLRSAKLEKGPVFRSVRNDVVSGSSLHPYSVNRILKKEAENSNLAEGAIRELSGHSMRVGAAQDMMATGMNILPIMAAGGWKTTRVITRYVEKAEINQIAIKRFNFTE